MSDSQTLAKTNIQFGILVAAALLLLPSPWLRDSSHLWMLEVSGLLLSLILLFLHRKALPLPGIALAFVIYASFALSLYLIPIPLDLWLQLPGRDFYHDIITLLSDTGHVGEWYAASINPYATAQMLLAILPALALFLALSMLDKIRLYWLAHLFVGMAAIQAAWGLIQYSAGGSAAHGSYINRDHYVTLMEFSLPIAVALIFHHVYLHDEERDEGKHKMLLAFYLGFAALIFLGGLFSMSRAGIPNLFIGIILTSLLLSRKTRKTHSFLFIGFFLTFTLVLAYFTGLIPVINRFIGQDPLEDARWVMFAQQWVAINQFFPLGSGPGTFTDVYTAFQPMEQVGAGFVKHAHNDYLEWLLETGLVGASILVFFTLVYIYGWIKLWGQPKNSLYLLQAAAGVGMLTSLLHAFFDFNFHSIPHPLIFAALSGIFLRKPQ